MSEFSEVFTHCPRCGSANFNINDARSKRCGDCGYVYYQNASAATAAVILGEGDEILVSRRALEPARGTLDLPGGFVDAGESIDEGMRREIREETGCEVESMRWLFSLSNSYLYSGLDVPTADSFFLCRLRAGGRPKAADDAAPSCGCRTCSPATVTYEAITPRQRGDNEQMVRFTEKIG